MAEYIEREAALEICETEYQKRLRMLDYCGDTVAWNIGGEIKALPAADVAPVVHGRWVSVPYKLARVCSVCNRDEPYKFAFADIDADLYDYCPNCGARMDGDSDG